jgi:hypothetical protein
MMEITLATKSFGLNNERRWAGTRHQLLPHFYTTIEVGNIPNTDNRNERYLKKKFLP